MQHLLLYPLDPLRAIDPPGSPDVWKKTLGRFDGLRHSKLSDDSIPDLVTLLALPAERAIQLGVARLYPPSGVLSFAA